MTSENQPAPVAHLAYCATHGLVEMCVAGLSTVESWASQGDRTLPDYWVQAVAEWITRLDEMDCCSPAQLEILQLLREHAERVGIRVIDLRASKDEGFRVDVLLAKGAH